MVCLQSRNFLYLQDTLDNKNHFRSLKPRKNVELYRDSYKLRKKLDKNRNTYKGMS